MMVMMMMMMMMIFVEWLTDQSLISSKDHCQGFSRTQIFDMPQAGFEPAHKMS